MKIHVFLGSTRMNGNSEQLTKQVLEGIRYKSTRLNGLAIQPIQDKRHSLEGFSIINDEYDVIINQILNSNVIIFATPIYWYSMSGQMKIVIDRLSQAIRDERYPQLGAHFKKIKSIVLATGGDDPHLKGLPMIQQFQYIFEFLGIHFKDYILAKGNKPGDIFKDSNAIQKAKNSNEWFHKEVENACNF